MGKKPKRFFAKLELANTLSTTGRKSQVSSIGVSHIEGRENVQRVTLDLCDPYKSFVKEFFPNAQMIADKFHVLRLLTGHINRRRKEITGDVRKNPVRKLLLRNGKDLEYFEKKTLYLWLDLHPELKELYHFKEALHGLYRVKGIKRNKNPQKNSSEMAKRGFKLLSLPAHKRKNRGF